MTTEPASIRRGHALAATAVVAVVAGNGLLWLDRPTAEPAPVQRHSAEAAQPEPTPRRDPPVPQSKPGEPLDLTLDPKRIEPRTRHGNTVPDLRETPGLAVTPETGDPARPFIAEDLRLFAEEPGTRAVTRGYWLSDRIRLRGGLGYVEDDEERDRDLAIGLGVDLAF